MHPKKERIFAAAIETFSRKGSANTTMQEVAETAGVGKGTLYRYFDNKEDLISSLVKAGIEEMTDQVKKAVAKIKDPAEKLEKIIITQLEFYNQRRDFCRFLTREIWGCQNKFKEHIKALRKNSTALLENVIEEGIELEEFKGVDPETAAVSLNGMVNITALHWFMFQDEFPIEKIKDDIITLYFEGILENR
jgi:AcrR family transcriptional regulator